MKIIDRYLDKWISKKALGILRHKLAMVGFKTEIVEKSTYYDINIQKYHIKEKPVYFFTLNIIDGLEFYKKWFEIDFKIISEWAEDTLKNANEKNKN